jgi:hypothetical protein
MHCIRLKEHTQSKPPKRSYKNKEGAWLDLKKDMGFVLHVILIQSRTIVQFHISGSSIKSARKEEFNEAQVSTAVVLLARLQSTTSPFCINK